MTEGPQPYPWTRREDESTPAYDAFRTYLNMGTERSTAAVARELGKSKTLMDRWSGTHSWADRVRAHDDYLMTAETDGHAEELARVRNRHMALADKLLDHLDRRLDDFIEHNQDPSVRWTQAFSAGTKAQESATRMREQGKESGLLEQILAKVQKLESE